MLSWPTNPVIASIFAALPFSELARVLVRLDQAESAPVKCWEIIADNLSRGGFMRMKSLKHL
jgi:hypothetical protein